jgi:tRNA (guanine-N7-)-methyltransferase
MPKKRFYRQRAHCNPLNDTLIDVPACPAAVNWGDHYPAFFGDIAGSDKREEYRVSIADVGCGFGGMSVTCDAFFYDSMHVKVL